MALHGVPRTNRPGRWERAAALFCWNLVTLRRLWRGTRFRNGAGAGERSRAGSTVILPVSFINGKTIYHFGSMGRNVLIGPRFNNTDVSLIKRTTFGENKVLEFRWEVFDVFNHANFGQPGRTAQVGSTAFGVITNTRFPTGDSGSSRQMQFALKFKF